MLNSHLQNRNTLQSLLKFEGKNIVIFFLKGEHIPYFLKELCPGNDVDRIRNFSAGSFDELRCIVIYCLACPINSEFGSSTFQVDLRISGSGAAIR